MDDKAGNQKKNKGKARATQEEMDKWEIEDLEMEAWDMIPEVNAKPTASGTLGNPELERSVDAICQAAAVAQLPSDNSRDVLENRAQREPNSREWWWLKSTRTAGVVSSLATGGFWATCNLAGSAIETIFPTGLTETLEGKFPDLVAALVTGGMMLAEHGSDVVTGVVSSALHNNDRVGRFRGRFFSRPAAFNEPPLLSRGDIAEMGVDPNDPLDGTGWHLTADGATVVKEEIEEEEISNEEIGEEEIGDENEENTGEPGGNASEEPDELSALIEEFSDASSTTRESLRLNERIGQERVRQYRAAQRGGSDHEGAASSFKNTSIFDGDDEEEDALKPSDIISFEHHTADLNQGAEKERPEKMFVDVEIENKD